MEFKPSMITIFLLFLLLLLTTPCFSKGGLDESNMDSGIYEIDYRGPETHSYIPPPNRSNQKASIHQENALTHRKSKGFRAGNGGNGKKIHG